MANDLNLGEILKKRRDHLVAYTFWVWQYQRRNPKYKAKYDEWIRIKESIGGSKLLDDPIYFEQKRQEVFELHDKKGAGAAQNSNDPELRAVIFRMHFYDEFGRIEPKDPFDDEDSSVILNDVLLAGKDFTPELDSLSDLEVVWRRSGQQSCDFRDHLGRPNIMFVMIDTNIPVKVILNEIKWRYYYRKQNVSIESLFHTTTFNSTDELDFFKTYIDFIEYWKNQDWQKNTSDSSLRFSPNHKARALGVWIWDYMKNNGVSRTEAYMHLESHYDNFNEKYKEDIANELQKKAKKKNTTTLDDYIRNTIKCIEAVVPLAMNK